MRARSRLALATCVAVAGVASSATPGLGMPDASRTSPVLGGRYIVDTSQSRFSGEVWIGHTGPRFASGTAFGAEWPCPDGSAFSGEIAPVGRRIAADGRFSARETDHAVMHVSGRFVSARLATGVIWGWSGRRDCLISSRHPVRFRAHYVGHWHR